MALGAPPRALADRPLLPGLQIALGGIALGVPVGLAADAWLAGVMKDFFPLPVIDASFQGHVRAGGALGLLLPMLAAAFPVWRALRVAPVDAIRVGARAARSSGLAWLVKDMRIPGGSLANMPLRNVLHTPHRTVMTLLGIGAIVTIVVALSGVMDSFDRTLDAGRREAVAGAPDRLTVDLVAPVRAGAEEVRRVASAESVGATDASLRLPSHAPRPHARPGHRPASCPRSRRGRR